MSHSLIRQIFESKLHQWAESEGIDVVYENITYSPEVGKAYIKADLKPSNTSSDTLSGDHTCYKGLFQILIYVPLSEGTKRANELAEEIKTLFPIYSRMKKGTFVVQPVTPVSVMDGITGDASYALPVFFRYRSDV